MSKKIFSEKEINELSKNKYVKKVSQKGITYTNEFKLHFIAEYEMGKTPRQIFQDAGFDIQVIGIKRIECASDRWRKSYKEKGVLGLDDKRALNSGRTLNRELTLEEILAKKDEDGQYYLKFYQSSFYKGKFPATITEDDFGEKELDFARIIHYDDHFVKLIFGSLDVNAYAYIPCERNSAD